MSNSNIQIVVACGSGIATSTIAADAVTELLKEIGINNYKIIKTSMTELPSHVDSADVILTTNNYKNDEKPCVNIMGFVTGINEDGLKSKLKDLFLELNK
ncbi:PTS sugar transporter subunit IIB [Bacillus sp. FJAT-50079]|uniref:PTS sugar transporter subunit IIB n=1 Tax=Bacillus sp. FJAT-50079 TaxID=2833577 RepID=UPI001BC96DA1|nr:PTS sugar transporter subunit IIB [Bacillus sp. FJAT-50079]MBS4210476.1 PTS sugar transporter subunit IIB [Bacillus sp. FJAT-50079]